MENRITKQFGESISWGSLYSLHINAHQERHESTSSCARYINKITGPLWQLIEMRVDQWPFDSYITHWKDAATQFSYFTTYLFCLVSKLANIYKTMLKSSKLNQEENDPVMKQILFYNSMHLAHHFLIFFYPS